MLNFIKKIQQSDETTRKRWLVILSSITIFIIIGLWLSYFNNNLMAINPPSGQKIAEESKTNSILKVKLSSAGEKTVTGLANSYVFFKDKLTNRNGFTISRSNQNFIWDDLEKLPEQKLP